MGNSNTFQQMFLGNHMLEILELKLLADTGRLRFVKYELSQCFVMPFLLSKASSLKINYAMNDSTKDLLKINTYSTSKTTLIKSFL